MSIPGVPTSVSDSSDSFQNFDSTLTTGPSSTDPALRDAQIKELIKCMSEMQKKMDKLENTMKEEQTKRQGLEKEVSDLKEELKKKDKEIEDMKRYKIDGKKNINCVFQKVFNKDADWTQAKVSPANLLQVPGTSRQSSTPPSSPTSRRQSQIFGVAADDDLDSSDDADPATDPPSPPVSPNSPVKVTIIPPSASPPPQVNDTDADDDVPPPNSPAAGPCSPVAGPSTTGPTTIIASGPSTTTTTTGPTTTTTSTSGPSATPPPAPAALQAAPGGAQLPQPRPARRRQWALVADPGLIVVGKRQRRAPERYQAPADSLRKRARRT